MSNDDCDYRWQIRPDLGASVLVFVMVIGSTTYTICPVFIENHFKRGENDELSINRLRIAC